jgi:HTH-type transcriptional regulator / antitoxin HipB
LLSFKNACYRLLSEKKAIAYMYLQARTVGEIGAAIRSRRRELGWDQATLADRIGVSRLWVNQIEKGKPGAGIGLVLRAFAALDLTPILTKPGFTQHAGDAPPPIVSPDFSEIFEAVSRKSKP